MAIAQPVDGQGASLERRGDAPALAKDADARDGDADGAGRLYAQVTLDQMRRRDGKFAKAEISDWPQIGRAHV